MDVPRGNLFGLILGMGDLASGLADIASSPHQFPSQWSSWSLLGSPSSARAGNSSLNEEENLP